MITIFRRLRGVAVTAVSWAIGWTLLGALFRIVWPAESGLGFPSLTMLLGSALSWIVPGAIGGTVFALLVMGGGRERLEDLTMRHATITGVLAGGLLPLIAAIVGSAVSGALPVGVFPLLPQYAIAGGLCGAAWVALARRAAPTDGAPLAEESVAPAT